VAAVGAGVWKDFAMVDRVHRVQGVQKPIAANADKYRRLMPAFDMLRRHQAELGDLLENLQP
jgi:hypothetical protein